jgi:hypothetical protein
MKILMTGSSGLVGTALTRALVGDGHTVLRLVRVGCGAKKDGTHAEANGKHGEGAGRVGRADLASGAAGRASFAGAERVIDVPWNPSTCDLERSPFGAASEMVERADAVVNLAGASIADESWSEERKALLRSSRVHTTRALVNALEKMQARPKLLLSASAIGYYGNRGDEILTEESKPGNGFLANVTVEWEAEAIKAEALRMREIRVRFGVILAKEGGALPQMVKPFQYGFGGRIGDGKQWMSWITLADAVGVLRYALSSYLPCGPMNVVSPQPVQNAEFAKELAKTIRRPAIFPAPKFALRLMLGEMADALLLSSQRVTPARLEHVGYRFLHADLHAALAATLA